MFRRIFRQRVLRDENPRIAFIEDNTDTFTARAASRERMQQIQSRSERADHAAHASPENRGRLEL